MSAKPPVWQNRITGSGVKPASQFLAHPLNWRQHPPMQREALATSLNRVGWVQQVIENTTTGHLLDGHERVWQALQADDADVPFIQVALTEDEERFVLATLDPISALAEIDGETLKLLAGDDIDLSQFFNPDELAAILADAADEPPGDPGAAISRAEEWQTKWSCERGQVWQIGRHRLLVGSAYDPALVARLMDGKVPDMLHIDPPYGISIVKPVDGSSAAAIGGSKPFGKTGAPGNRAIWDRAGKGKRGTTSGARAADKNGLLSKNGSVGGVPLNAANMLPGARAALERQRVGSANTPHAKGARTTANVYPVMQGDQKPDVLAVGKHIEVYGKAIIQSNLYPVIEGDDTPFDPTLFVAYAPVVVMWGANYYADRLPISSGWICWDKREDITRNNFADGELAWTNQQKPMRIFHHLWNGLHKGSQHGERRLHPTEKPVALFEEIGRLFADGGLWLDLFAGSGPQLVAAERTGATCYAAEIEVLYCATILERLSQMGLRPERLP